MTAKFWTDAAIARLLELLEVEKLTCSQAAAALNHEFGARAITKNAVIGKAYRAGIVIGNGKRPKRVQMGRVAAFKPAKPAKPPTVPAQIAQPLEATPKAATPAPDDLSRSVGLLDLTPFHCRWPLGESPFRFCGEAAIAGRSYCQTHHQIAYSRVQAAKADDLLSA